jgi:flagellar biosynthesis/type III secretory pathway protein FliH
VDTGTTPQDDSLIRLIEDEMACINIDAAWKESMMPFLTVEDDARIQARISYEDGRSEGLAEGRSEGEAAMAALMERLFAEGRTEDARRAAIDAGIRARLLNEYGL